jgi:hypothetical protein
MLHSATSGALLHPCVGTLIESSKTLRTDLIYIEKRAVYYLTILFHSVISN